MQTTPDLVESPVGSFTLLRHHHSSSLSWAAILAGVAAALAAQVLFVMLGAGLGFAIYHPLTNDNPVADLGTGAIVIHGISAVVSLWFGGWIAGRFTPFVSRAAGGLHGLLVWCASTVLGIVVVATGAGWIMGDLSKLVSGGLAAAGKPAAAIAGVGADAAKDAAKQSTDTISSFVDEAVAGRQGGANGPMTANSIAAKREVGLAAARLFNPMNEGKEAENRAALASTLVNRAGVSQADADRMVREWSDSYDRLKADLAAAKEQAAQKAKVAAEEAAKVLTIVSLATFFAFVLGAAAAAGGGRQGALAAFRRDYGAVVTR